MNLVCLSNRVQLTKNKLKYFFYQTTNLLKIWFLFLSSTKGQNSGKSKFITNFVRIIVTIILYVSLKLIVYSTKLYTVLFHWSLQTQNRKKNNLQNTFSKSLPPTCALFGELSSWYNYFLILRIPKGQSPNLVYNIKWI